MITILLIILVAFALVSIAPLLRLFVYKKSVRGMTEKVYTFSKDLVDGSLENLKCENLNNRGRENQAYRKIKKQSLQIRGSVRLAHDRILTERDMERKKTEVYSSELP